jgi:glycosyltransferase involved in cell wall biosynthesis
MPESSGRYKTLRPDSLHLIVITRAVAPLHGVGGLERHVHDLVSHLLDRGARVTLITRPASDGAAAASADLIGRERLTVRTVPYWTFPLAGRRGTTVLDRSTAYPWFGQRAGALAADLVRGGGIHLVHGMGAASLGYARARRQDWFGTVPFVFNPHGMEEFGSTGSGLSGLKGMAYGPLRHAVLECAAAADRVVATDRVLVPTVLQHLKIPEARVGVVPNAVDLDAIDRAIDPGAAKAVRDRLGLSPEDALLVGVGRLEENKGFQHLIAALAQWTSAAQARAIPAIGRWKCVLLGEGSYRARLAQDVAAAGLGDSVLLPGRVSDAELHAWYEAATLFVHPTIYEGSSIVTLEAMAHRRAIVATSAGGLPDKVRPGVNGWLVAPGDPPALARAIDDALSRRDRLVVMGAESRAIVEREFSWSAVLGRLFDLYDEVLSGRNSRA